MSCLLAFALSACIADLEKSGVLETRGVSAPLSADKLVGRWGLASYHDAKDARRVEAAARGQCGQSLRDRARPRRLGPDAHAVRHQGDERWRSRAAPAPAISARLGGPQIAGDREVIRWDGRVLVLKWLDPQAAATYGTMVFVRCGSTAA